MLATLVQTLSKLLHSGVDTECNSSSYERASLVFATGKPLSTQVTGFLGQTWGLKSECHLTSRPPRGVLHQALERSSLSLRI